MSFFDPWEDYYEVQQLQQQQQREEEHHQPNIQSFIDYDCQSNRDDEHSVYINDIDRNDCTQSPINEGWSVHPSTGCTAADADHHNQPQLNHHNDKNENDVFSNSISPISHNNNSNNNNEFKATSSDFMSPAADTSSTHCPMLDARRNSFSHDSRRNSFVEKVANQSVISIIAIDNVEQNVNSIDDDDDDYDDHIVHEEVRNKA